MTRIINIFRHNLLKKMIALLVAFIMWVYVMADQDPAIEGSYTVPLTMSNTPYEYMAVSEETTVQINTRAPRSYYVKYDANAFRVYANLEGLGEGVHQINPQVVMPSGFELVETKPTVLNVKLDPLTERQIPIEILTSGTVGTETSIKEIGKSMEYVTIVGAKSFVEQVSKVYGTVKLNNQTNSFEVQIPLNAVDEKNQAVNRIHVVPSVITASVEIESGIKKRIVPIIPELSVMDGWELTKITVEPAQMEISGAESVINSIVTLKTVPFTVQTGQRFFKSTLRLVVPEGVTIPSNEVTVTAEVIRKPVMRDQTSN